MIAVAVKDYDDENIVEECEDGWRRFCAEVLVRTHYHIKELARRHKRVGFAGMMPRNRKEMEYLRRQVAAYRWVFEGTGGLFTFDQTCADIGLDPHLVRQKILSLLTPDRDINPVVRWVARTRERCYGDDCRQGQGAGGLGASVVDSVRDFWCRHGQRAGRRGVQTHAVCRYSDGHKNRRRPRGAS